MIVSWNWLKDYVPLKDAPADVVQRLMMAGLNLESTEQLGSDVIIDLEVTSNRPDCLGHIGIAREASVLSGLPLSIPEPTVAAPEPTVTAPEPIAEPAPVAAEPAPATTRTERVAPRAAPLAPATNETDNAPSEPQPAAIDVATELQAP